MFLEKYQMKKIFSSLVIAAACGGLSAAAPQFAPADSWQKAPWHPGAKHFNCMKVENNIVTLSKDDASTLSFSPAKALATDLQAGQKMRFSIDFKGSGAPKNYEYAMVLEIVYTDNTKEKWHQGSVFIPLPKKLDEFKTFTAQFVAAKPVKRVSARFLFNGKFNVQLKNPVFTVDSDAEKAAFNQGNMLENCDFEYIPVKDDSSTLKSYSSIKIRSAGTLSPSSTITISPMARFSPGIFLRVPSLLTWATVVTKLFSFSIAFSARYSWIKPIIELIITTTTITTASKWFPIM